MTTPNKLAQMIGSALRTAVDNARYSGSALATFCTVAKDNALPAVVPAETVDAIVDAYADGATWKGTDAEKVRKSEARALVAAHALLPEGMQAYRTATGGCGYTDAVKVARAIRKGGTVEAAMAELTADGKATKASPDDKMVKALNAYHKAIREGKRKDKATRLAAIEAFASAVSLKLKTE